MNIHIVCIGKLKERYFQEAIAEYSKRLGAYCRLTIDELKEARLQDKAGAAEEAAVKKAEGESILGRIKQNEYVIALDVQGSEMTSEALAEKIQTLGTDGNSQVCLIIGGSLGLSEEVKARADLRLSFSQMTFPHQMMRVILLEQIYRCFKIIKKETYHK